MGLIARLLLNERAKFDRVCGELQTARSFPEDVEEIRDIPYLPDSESVHRMDVYRPKRTDGPLPVVLDVHGGGLAMGSKAYNRWFNAQLCRRGFLVYSADYRLVPEHPGPYQRDVLHHPPGQGGPHHAQVPVRPRLEEGCICTLSGPGAVDVPGRFSTVPPGNQPK